MLFGNEYNEFSIPFWSASKRRCVSSQIKINHPPKHINIFPLYSTIPPLPSLRYPRSLEPFYFFSAGIMAFVWVFSELNIIIHQSSLLIIIICNSMAKTTHPILLIVLFGLLLALTEGQTCSNVEDPSFLLQSGTLFAIQAKSRSLTPTPPPQLPPQADSTATQWPSTIPSHSMASRSQHVHPSPFSPQQLHSH